jgi:SPP1 family predicted phage head-tail adaptor
MVNVGRRRHLVTLQNPGPAVPDNEGGYTQSWEYLTPSTAWASITPATARDLERVVAGTVQSTATHIVQILFHPGVTTQTRLLFKGRTLQVTGVSNWEERDVMLILTCEETVQ